MRILYFAWIRERIGVAEEDLPLPGDVANAADLARFLRTRSPGHLSALGDLGRIRIAVNQTHVPASHPVTDADEIAFFPPVTGG